MLHYEVAFATTAMEDEGQDRVAVFERPDRLVIVVADGAGNTSDGAAAAETVIGAVERAFVHVESAQQWVSELRRIDAAIDSGETTAVVLDIQQNGICGASVGDSRAWCVNKETTTDLTKNQVRKPLLGSGAARPVGFDFALPRALILVGTDGFFNYAKIDAIRAVSEIRNLQSIPKACIDLVRLPSGALWDDVGIVACRLVT